MADVSGSSRVTAESTGAGHILSMVPVGKVRCYITGKLRPDKPEEHVRQRWARSLVEEYRYDKADIAIGFRVKMGRARKEADLVVFKEGAPHKQENAFIVIEAKRADVKPRDASEGVEQLKSYMAACSSCQFGMWVGEERQVFQRMPDGEILDAVADIPSRGELGAKVPVFADLVPAVDLRATFRRCHNYIYVNQGLQKAEAFHEMLKLIFCKVYDETETDGELRFYIHSEERRSEAGQRRVSSDRIAPLFEAVKARYPYIFKSGESIDLNRKVLAYTVSELQRISLLRTQADVKGSAYEELVGQNLRGDRGEYFTPRNVCDMAVAIVMATYAPRRLTSLKVLDLCCGTGGFLVSYLNHLRQFLTAQEQAKRSDEQEIRARVATRIKELCSANLFGLDINPFLVRTCQMNLVMHGDGSANVFQADSLVKPSEWVDQDAADHVRHGRFDVVVTNPPFGGRALIDDPHVLAQYELTTADARAPRSSLPAEQLFLEAAWNFLKPGGRLAIVLPDSILNNPSLEFIRKWAMRRARVVGSVDLPKETFATSGGVPNPSVLVLRKFNREDLRLAERNALDDYEVFMAIPKTSGIDKRGNPVYIRTPEGYEVLSGDSQQPLIDDEVALVAPRFADWIRDMGYVSE